MKSYDVASEYIFAFLSIDPDTDNIRNILLTWTDRMILKTTNCDCCSSRENKYLETDWNTMRPIVVIIIIITTIVE